MAWASGREVRAWCSSLTEVLHEDDDSRGRHRHESNEANHW